MAESRLETANEGIAATGIDAAALKPAECDVSRGVSLPFETLVIDYEGPRHLPERDVLERLAAEKTVRLTTPVRAEGFDPLGDDELARALPREVGRVLVAGHSAYLSEREREKAVAPRLGAAIESAPEAWVGTEGVERIALATGATQFELLGRTTGRDLRALRAAGFAGEIAVYAPTVPADSEDAILDAVGGYVARRRAVSRALPEGAQTDASATGRAREVLLAASADFALVGPPERIGERVAALREAGADAIVGYPASGIESFLG
ncbi:MAG: luciferase [Halalkalicoccus sp.]